LSDGAGDHDSWVQTVMSGYDDVADCSSRPASASGCSCGVGRTHDCLRSAYSAGQSGPVDRPAAFYYFRTALSTVRNR
jgi:hypothetical protein